MIALRLHQVTMLQHPNIATKYMAVIYRRCLTKDNSELRLDHTIAGSNKHGKSAEDIRFTDLVELLDMPETASGSNVQSKQSICYKKLT